MRYVVLLLAVVSFVLAARPARAAGDPLACDGYAERRVYLESQAWWSPTEQDDGAEHIHVSTCWPWSGYGQALSGVVPLDVRVQLHHNQGASERLRVQDWDQEVWTGPLALGPCEQCEKTIHLDFDTARFCNGRREARWNLFETLPGGDSFYHSTAWQWRISNPGRDCRANQQRGTDNFTRAKGWEQHGAHYTLPQVDSPLPLGPLSGIWSIRWETQTENRGATSGHAVYVDPAFHAVPPSKGVVIREAAGNFRGTTAIDTTRLSNGWHRLVLRSDSVTGLGKTSGLLVVGFEVRN